MSEMIHVKKEIILSIINQINRGNIDNSAKYMNEKVETLKKENVVLYDTIRIFLDKLRNEYNIDQYGINVVAGLSVIIYESIKQQMVCDELSSKNSLL